MPCTCRPSAVAALVLFLWLGDASMLPAQAPRVRDSLEARLLALLVEREPGLALQRARLATSEVRLRAAGPREAPTLSAEIEDIPDGVNLPDAGQARLMFEREFLTGGRREAERSVARTARDIAALRLGLAHRAVAAGLQRDLLLWRGWRAIGARLAAEDSLLGEVEAGLAARFASGDARYVDVLRLRTERLRVQVERAEALRSSQAGRRVIEAMLPPADSGQVVLAALLSAVSMEPVPPVREALPPPPEVDSLLGAIGVLRLADLEIEAALAQVARVRAEQSARLVGGIGVQRFGDARGGFEVGPSLRAAVSLPWMVRGSTRALEQAADVAVSEAEASRTAMGARLRLGLVLARDRYAAALERLEVFDAALLTGAREEREAALGGYRAGQLSLLELLDFERALARAETDHLRARIEAGSAYAHLLSAAGAFDPARGGHDSEVSND